jgi:hypothetical protein
VTGQPALSSARRARGRHWTWLLIAIWLAAGAPAAHGQGIEPSASPAPQPAELPPSPAAATSDPAPASPLPVSTGESKSRLSDQAVALQPIPPRPPLLLEWNDSLLGPGYLGPGIELPTGEVIRPALWVFGINRTAVQHYENHEGTNANEVVERLDLFTQLNLSGTERVLLGLRPFDKEDLNRRQYTSYDFGEGRGLNGMNANVQTLFFEGDLGQMFPALDQSDRHWLDYGFSVGRQPVLIQDGLLINADALDAVTLARNALSGDGILNGRATLMYACDGIHRSDDIYDPSAQLIGLYMETDLKKSTIDLDVVYINADHVTGSACYLGVSSAQRLFGPYHTFNDTFHVLSSFPLNGPTPATGRGTLLFNEISLNTDANGNILYCNTFWAIDRFSSAARAVETGGPLGQVGLLFGAPLLGRYRTALSDQADDVIGGSIGYQIFLDRTRKQLVLELGARQDTNSVHEAALGFAARYQQAMGQHCILILDGFISKQEKLDPATGARLELLTKF